MQLNAPEKELSSLTHVFADLTLSVHSENRNAYQEACDRLAKVGVKVLSPVYVEELLTSHIPPDPSLFDAWSEEVLQLHLEKPSEDLSGGSPSVGPLPSRSK